MKRPCRVAVIGGSGLYAMPGLKAAKPVAVKTPFGAPSGPIVVGELSGTRCAFLARHGAGHVLTPSEINVRANIWALKSLGAERLLAVAAVGSLKEEFAPRHFAFPDQLFDKTKDRPATFFGDGIVAHVAFDEPFCRDLQGSLHGLSTALGVTSHLGGTYVCMEGPQFSTRAESLYHQSLGFSVIGMTAVTEAKLAREAELCYGLVCLVTDYDCWKHGEEVSADKVVEVMHDNVAAAQRLLEKAVPAAAALPRRCRCGNALAGAIVTDPKRIPAKTAKKLELIIGRRLPRRGA